MKSRRKEGGSVRKCHTDREMLVGTTVKRLGQTQPEEATSAQAWGLPAAGLPEARMGMVPFIGQKGRQRPMVMNLRDRLRH